MSTTENKDNKVPIRQRYRNKIPQTMIILFMIEIDYAWSIIAEYFTHE